MSKNLVQRQNFNSLDEDLKLISIAEQTAKTKDG